MVSSQNITASMSAESSSQFYCNYHCKYFPCHKTDSEKFNCIFCYCPMHYLPHCLGKPKFIQTGGSSIKDCSICDYPHRSENYGRIIEYLIETKRNGIEGISRQFEKRYRVFFEESKEAIVMTSGEGAIIDCNQSALALLGYTKDEAMQLNAQYLYVYPEDRKKFQEEIESRGYVRDYRVKLRRRDGSEMDCSFTFTVQLGRDGRVAGYQGIIREIPEQWERQEKEPIRQFSVSKDLPVDWLAFRRIYC